jgi:hypothetical protein
VVSPTRRRCSRVSVWRASWNNKHVSFARVLKPDYREEDYVPSLGLSVAVVDEAGWRWVLFTLVVAAMAELLLVHCWD